MESVSDSRHSRGTRHLCHGNPRNEVLGMTESRIRSHVLNSRINHSDSFSRLADLPRTVVELVEIQRWPWRCDIVTPGSTAQGGGCPRILNRGIRVVNDIASSQGSNRERQRPYRKPSSHVPMDIGGTCVEVPRISSPNLCIACVGIAFRVRQTASSANISCSS